MNDLTQYFDTIKCKFFSCFPTKNINWQDFETLSWDEQKTLLDNTILHPLNIEKPIKKSYQRSFLKSLIQALEENNIEVHDLVYEEFCNLQSATTDEQNFSFKHYCINAHKVIVTLKESNSFISSGTTGLCSWQASLALSEWILHNSTLLSDKVILELGAGPGLSGIVAAKTCKPKKVYLTDGSRAVVKLLSENLEFNFSAGSNLVEEIFLPWEDISSAKIDPEVDVILGADIVYDNSIFSALSGAIDKLFSISCKRCKMFLAATVRNVETLSEFLKLLESRTYVVQEEQYFSPKNLFWDESTPIKIFCIKKE